MRTLFALIVVGLDAAATRFKSKIEKTAAAVVVGVVGIGLLASPFLLQANDDEKTNDAPNVGCLWVANSGSIGFEVDFDVTFSPDADEDLIGFQLKQDDEGIVNDVFLVKRATLRSVYCDWLDIPGYDGSGIPYPGYPHSFDFVVEGVKFHGFVRYGNPRFDLVTSLVSSVSVQLYVEVNGNGSLRSMNAWAVDSDGDSYEVPVYYSAGGWEGVFETF